MDFSKLKTGIILGFIVLTSLLYLAYDLTEDTSISSVKATHHQDLLDNTELPLKVITPSINSLSNSSNNSIEVKAPTSQIKSYQLKPILYLPNIMEFINGLDGGVDDLSAEHKLMLSTSLQYCGIRLGDTPELKEETKEALYSSGFVPNNADVLREKMCANVPESLINRSYSLLEEIAVVGDMQGALGFYMAQSPEMFALNKGNEREQSDYDEPWLAHKQRAEHLLVDSIYNGSVPATLTMATNYMIGGMGTKKDYKRSIVYFKALHYIADENTSYDRHINSMSEELTFTEMRAIDKQAVDLVELWKSLPDGIWKRH